MNFILESSRTEMLVIFPESGLISNLLDVYKQMLLTVDNNEKQNFCNTGNLLEKKIEMLFVRKHKLLLFTG